MSDPKEQLSKEQLQQLMRDTVLPESGLDGLSSQENPRAIVLAGQAGAGKSSLPVPLNASFVTMFSSKTMADFETNFLVSRSFNYIET